MHKGQGQGERTRDKGTVVGGDTQAHTGTGAQTPDIQTARDADNVQTWRYEGKATDSCQVHCVQACAWVRAGSRGNEVLKGDGKSAQSFDLCGQA